MSARGYRLGVDFGTSNTVAMLAWPDGHVRPLLFDGSPTLPSAVYADQRSGLLVGRDAMHAARIAPERYEPNPKRRIDEPAVLLGEREYATVDLIAAVLARVAGEARRVCGGALESTTVTCPAAWAQTRRGVLLAAAERAGLGAVTLVPEPVSAAEVFRTLTGEHAPRALPGSAFVVYDLGAGTFDASVVRHGGGSFEVLSAEGLATSGGLDIDAQIVGYLGAVHAARNPDAWARLTHPATSADRRANRLLWDDVRSAKEMLSRTATTMIHIPALDTDVPLGRDQFEQLARPILTATVTATRAAISAAGLSAADVEGVFLVGGGSRIPLVATLLHQALGKAPTVVEQPELVVAQGAVGASMQFTLPTAGQPVSSAGYSAPISGGAPYGAAAAPGSPYGAMSSPSPAYGAAGGPAAAYGAAGVPGPVSGPPAAPISAVPGSGIPAAPVSPALSSMPVTGYPVSPAAGGGAAAPPGVAPPASGAARPTAAASVASGFVPARPAAAVPPQAAAVPPQAAGGLPPVAGSASATGPAPGPVWLAAGPPGAGTPGDGGGRKRRTGILVAIFAAVLLAGGGGAYAASQWLGGNQSSGDGGSGQDSAATADVDHADVDWTSTAEEYDGKADKTVGYECPAQGTIGTVWGSGPYTTDSSVCTAAVHAGKISLESGGRVVIKIRAGENSYQGSTKHDIVTTAYDSYPWAFDIIS